MICAKTWDISYCVEEIWGFAITYHCSPHWGVIIAFVEESATVMCENVDIVDLLNASSRFVESQDLLICESACFVND